MEQDKLEIPRFKFGYTEGTVGTIDTLGQLDGWYIIDTQTEKIVEYLSNCELSDVRKRCKEWNDDPIIKFL